MWIWLCLYQPISSGRNHELVSYCDIAQAPGQYLMTAGANTEPAWPPSKPRNRLEHPLLGCSVLCPLDNNAPRLGHRLFHFRENLYLLVYTKRPVFKIFFLSLSDTLRTTRIRWLRVQQASSYNLLSRTSMPRTWSCAEQEVLTETHISSPRCLCTWVTYI